MNPDFSFAVLLSDMLTIVDSFVHFVISTKHACQSILNFVLYFWRGNWYMDVLRHCLIPPFLYKCLYQARNVTA
jgi:hypothetical protein